VSSILLIRHAQSRLHGRFCGSSDPPLSAAGEAEAQALAAKLRATPIGRIYSSPLRRAVMTAEALAATRGMELSMMDGLRELDFGEWEGLTWSEIELRDPQFAKPWLDQFPKRTAPGGETFKNFQARVESAFAQVQSEMKRDSLGTIAVVAHSAVLGVILARTSGQPFRSIPPPANATVYEISGG
jgi:alpha-ribazole phosphatase/probable phosphoglycerate mutase